VPEIKIPEIKSRRVRMPKVKTQMGEVKIPDVKIPDIKVPAIKLPEMALPRISITSASAVKQAKKKLPARRGGPNVISVVGGAIAGALLFFFLDPEHGAARRAQARDQILATIRRLNGNVAQLGGRAGANANGFSQKMIHLRSGSAPVDDLTLRDRVESEIFRDQSLPKGRINFDVESGVVTIRGQVDNAQQIVSIEKAVLKVRGVNGVENLMHLQGTPAPNKVEARESV
jgi:BON domain-containing protein